MDTNASPGFGSILRGLRLGYGWSSKHGCFIRISDAGHLILIQLAPPRQIPTSRRKDNPTHRCWWDEPEVLDLCTPLANIRSVKRPLEFYVTQEGELAA